MEEGSWLFPSHLIPSFPIFQLNLNLNLVSRVGVGVGVGVGIRKIMELATPCLFDLLITHHLSLITSHVTHHAALRAVISL